MTHYTRYIEAVWVRFQYFYLSLIVAGGRKTGEIRSGQGVRGALEGANVCVLLLSARDLELQIALMFSNCPF